MANDSFKVKKALNIEPNTAPNLSTDGDIGFNSTDSNLEVYTGGSVKKILTNSQAQVITSKDIDGGTASNTSRITLPKSDKATLDGLTRKEGTVVYATDQQKAYIDNGTILTEVGSGSGGGGINYILNPDAEVNADGWDEYADAAGTSPVDGTGGSPTLTITRTTSSPLRGDASFLITKDAANRQGEGASYNFEIDSADQGKVIQITFDYAIASGTYATGDLAVYVIHDPNGTPKVIQPSAYQIENVGVNSTARLTFQTEVSAQLDYTLCFHVASVSASAYTVKLDNVQLGPQVVPMGAPVTDWVSYTPTIGLTGGSNTSTAVWRRVGDQLEVRISTTFTSVFTGGNATYTIPSGLTIDTTKLPGFAGGAPVIGQAELRDVGTDQHAAVVEYQTTNSVLVRAFQDDSGPSSTSIVLSAVSTTVPFTWANNDIMSIEFQVPIVGWSSSTVVSSSADTRVVAFRSTNIAGTSFTGGAGFVDVPFATEAFDTHGAFATPTFTAPVPGIYAFDFNLNTAAVTLTTSQGLQGRFVVTGKSSGNYDGYIIFGNGASANYNVRGTLSLDMNAGDTIKLQLAADATTALNSTAGRNYFQANLIQGPSQIAASEVIAMDAYAPTSTHTSSTAIMTGWTESLDTHGAFNPTTGIFTAPAPGVYKYACTYTPQNTATPCSVFAYKNGVVVTGGRTGSAYSNGTVYPSAHTHGCILLNAGDTLSFYAQNSSGSAITTNGASTLLDIHRLGGVM